MSNFCRLLMNLKIDLSLFINNNLYKFKFLLFFLVTKYDLSKSMHKNVEKLERKKKEKKREIGHLQGVGGWGPESNSQLI